MEIDEMEAGPDLNALVAEKVLGLRVRKDEYFYQYYVGTITTPRQTLQEVWVDVPDYSFSIAAAFEVVEKLCAGELFFKMNYLFTEDAGCWAAFDTKGVADAHPLYRARADTIPHAICKAALKAVGEVLT